MPRHLYHFSPKTLRQMASMAGLEEVTITTHREPFIELSLRYIKDGAQEKIGVSYVPLARAKTPGITWKLARKAFRLTLLPVLNRLVGLFGPGEIIHAVFVKETAKHPATDIRMGPVGRTGRTPRKTDSKGRP
jgi:hypothetical protein